ncbi:MAG: HTTM domain-containing protein [Pirellulales bacterium]
MNGCVHAARTATIDWFRDVLAGWNRFWFAPSDPATLCLIRILGGAMLFYTHLVWSRDLLAFFGPNAWLSRDLLVQRHEGTYFWTVFRHLDAPSAIWGFHLFALGVFFCLMIGAFTRGSSVLAFLLMLTYLHRVPTALFGLDQINTIIAMYLMIGPAGARYSFDRWWKKRRGRIDADDHAPIWSTSANVALRLMQIHMCVMYFFAATRKLLGASWWDGSAMWLAFGNLEYQSIPMHWLAEWPMLIVVLSHVTIAWELSYAALIWPKMTRGVMLIGAVLLHLGIAIFLGMATFGLAMIIGNLAFLPSRFTRGLLERRPPGSGTRGEFRQ